MLKVEGERYEYETNQLLVMKKERIPFDEVTIETVYEEGNKTSHFNPIWDSIKIYMVILKFMASSLCSFLVDIVLFTLINFIIGDRISADIRLLIATVLARVISSLVNFSMNHRYVFKSNESTATTLPRYCILCVCQVTLSYVLLYLLAQVLLGLKAGFMESVVKCLVDLVLFLVSYQIQKRWVFKNSKALTKE
jgi:putative flippase GtrA